jgi:mannosyltransferase OCH1-like enzyme
MWQQHCQRLNPAWDAWQWTDAGNDDIIAREFPSFVQLFQQYDMKIKRIDAVRLFYLFLFAGGPLSTRTS